MKTCIQCESCQRYRKAHENTGPCRCGGVFVRRQAMKRTDVKMPKRVDDALVAGMAALYATGKSLAEVGRAFPLPGGKARCTKTVNNLLVSRGFTVRDHPTRHRPRLRNGQMARNRRHTDAEVRRLVAALPSVPSKVPGKCPHGFRIPPALKLEWREWTMGRRRWLISLLRERWPSTMPRTPFSANVQPFDYCSAEAWAIAGRENAGLPSRHWKVRIFPNSEGVIFEGALWFWSNKAGYRLGVWTSESGRPQLHRMIWERANGCAVPAAHVLRFADGNPNNFEPVNLVLASRNEVARENQAAFYTKQSRELTALLLKRSQAHAQNDLLKDIHSQKVHPHHHAPAKQRPRHGRPHVQRGAAARGGR